MGAGAPQGHRRRRRARRQAVEMVYQADVTRRLPSEVRAEWQALGRTVPPYAVHLALGVEEGLSEIDGLLSASLEGWTVARLAVVDRAILRVACFELKEGIPVAVAISEAVIAAQELSTDDSGRFVNGVLGRVARILAGEPNGDDAR